MNWFVSRRMPILPGPPPPPPPTGPQLVQAYVSCGTSLANAGETASAWAFTPPNPVGTNNCVVWTITYPSGTAPTISDNNGNSWTGRLAKTAPGGNCDTTTWVLPGANSGVTQFKATFGSAQQPVWFEYQEWSGIATSSAVNGTVGSASPVAAPTLATGSFTPGNNDANGGNLILAFFYDAFGSSKGPSGWVAGGSFSLMQGNAISFNTDQQGQPSGSEYLIQAASASINPGITATADASAQYNCVAVALKLSSGTGTSIHSGIRIIKSIKQIAANQNSAASVTLNFPTTGNFRIFTTSVSHTGSAGVSSVTDSEGNTWTDVSQSADTGAVYYWKGAANPGLKVTLHLSGSSSNNLDGWFLDVANGPAGTVVGAVGHNTTTGGPGAVQHMPDITPTATNSLIIATFTNGLGPTTSVSSPASVAFNNVALTAGGGTGEGDGGTVNSGDGFASLLNTSTSAQNWTWGTANNASMAAVAIEFLSG